MPQYNTRCDNYGKPPVSLLYGREEINGNIFYCKNLLNGQNGIDLKCCANGRKECQTFSKLIKDLGLVVESINV